MKPFASMLANFDEVEVVPRSGWFQKAVSPEMERGYWAEVRLNAMMRLFSDRLATPKWRARFQVNGLDRILEARRQGRRVILGFFHIGSFPLVPSWLRAMNVPVVPLVQRRPEGRPRIKRMIDRLSPFPDLPVILYRDQLRDAVKVLIDGNVLFLSLDYQTGKLMDLPIDGQWTFRMSTGAIRLASRYDAELIPCRLIDEGGWRFRFEAGKPVPREFLAGEPDMARVGQYLLKEMLPVIQKYPEQCHPSLLKCFHSGAPAVFEEEIE